MNHHYGDIIERIAEPPLWWDENAVPHQGADIYAREIALILIGCQACEKRFKVAMSRSWAGQKTRSLAERIADKSLHYGDPPNACDGNCGGATMNCIDLRVLEYWHKEDFKWKRDESLEVEIDTE